MKAQTKSRLTLSAELYSLRQNRVYLLMMILLLVGALIWVLMTIMEAGDESQVTTEALKYAVPINPNLDVAVFALVEKKRLLTESELETFPINRIIKDRSGSYSVIPFDTPKDEIEQLTTGSLPKSTPAPTPRPAAAQSATASGSGVFR